MHCVCLHEIVFGHNINWGKQCHICSKRKTPIELVSNILIMSLDGFHTSNSPVWDEIFQNYFKESLFEDVICEYFSSGISKTIKSTFTVWRNFKEPPSVLNIPLQIGTYDMTTGF